MRVVCPISGLQGFSYSHFKGKDEPLVSIKHPIFSIPTRTLLASIARSMKYGKYDNYDKEEKKLIFFALLENIGCVETWECAGDPSDRTVINYTESLFKLLMWYNVLNPGTLKLPKIRVTLLNNSFQNIGAWIEEVYNLRNEWNLPNHRRHLQDLMTQKEEILSKLFRTPGKTIFQLAPKLARWGLDVTEVKDEMRREEWFRILTLKPTDKELFSIDPVKIDEIWEFMHLHLFSEEAGFGSGTEYSMKLMELVRNLRELRKKGYSSFVLESLGANDGDISQLQPSRFFKITSPEGLREAYYKDKREREERSRSGESEKESEPTRLYFLQDRELSLLQKISSTHSYFLKEPYIEPVRNNYLDRLSDWVRVRSAWLATQSLRTELEEVRKSIREEVRVQSEREDEMDEEDREEKDITDISTQNFFEKLAATGTNSINATSNVTSKEEVN